MEKSLKNEVKAKQAFELSNDILRDLDKLNPDPNTAQAALGSAWIHLCIVLGWKKKDFLEIIEQIDFEDKNGTRKKSS